jgi:hypothetical protein
VLVDCGGSTGSASSAHADLTKAVLEKTNSVSSVKEC